MKNLTLKQLTELVMEQAREKGFGTSRKDISVPEKIALLHSEISEAYEAYRHKKIKGKGGFEEELGDVLQRLLHLSGSLKIDLEKAIIKKIGSNKKRNWNWKILNESHR
ncbi:MAG: MazG nucleotide pyrophosphohydrolase domain-containing protein [Candidatus Woykebacteria bacterium]